MRKIFLIIILCLNALFCTSQNFFEVQNLSGFNAKQSEMVDLESSATQIDSLIPQSPNEDFAIFSNSNYTVSNFIEGRNELLFNNIKSSALLTAKNYIIIQRLIYNDNIKIKVDCKLPKSGPFACLFLDNPDFESEIENIIKSKLAQGTIDDYYVDLNNTLQKLHSWMNKRIECCVTRTGCNICDGLTYQINEELHIYDVDPISTKLANLDFSVIPSVTILDDEFISPANEVGLKDDNNQEQRNSSLLNVATRLFYEDFDTGVIENEQTDGDLFCDDLVNGLLSDMSSFGSSITHSVYKYKFPRDCGQFDDIYDLYSRDEADIKFYFAYVNSGSIDAPAALYYKIEGGVSQNGRNGQTDGQAEKEALKALISQIYPPKTYFQSDCIEDLFSGPFLAAEKANAIISEGVSFFHSKYDHERYKEYYRKRIARAYDARVRSDQVYNLLYSQELHYIKASNPTFSGPLNLSIRAHYAICNDAVHSVLDYCGFYHPSCDALNFMLYSLEGNYGKAAWAAVGVLPVIGGLVYVRYGYKGKVLSFLKKGEKIAVDFDDLRVYLNEFELSSSQVDELIEFATVLKESGKLDLLLNPGVVKAWNKLQSAGATALQINTNWLGRISSWTDEGIEVAFAKNGNFIDVFRTNDGLQIGRIVDGNGDEALELLADGFAPLTYPSSGAIVSSKVLDIPVKRPCGHTITEGASIVKMSNGTVGVLEDVSDYASILVKKALTNPNYHLRKALLDNNLVSAAEQAHHLIPIELLQKNNVVKDAIEAGFDFNGVVNGKGLGKVVHNGSHGIYTDKVLSKITDWKATADAAGTYSADAAKNFLEGLSTNLKGVFDTQTGVPIDQLVF